MGVTDKTKHGAELPTSPTRLVKVQYPLCSDDSSASAIPTPHAVLERCLSLLTFSCSLKCSHSTPTSGPDQTGQQDLSPKQNKTKQQNPKNKKTPR